MGLIVILSLDFAFLLWIAGLYVTLCKVPEAGAPLFTWPSVLRQYYRGQKQPQTAKPSLKLAWGTDRGYCSGMAKKDPERMTAEEEVQGLLKWAEQQRFENVAAALRRVLTKLPVS